MEKEEVKEETKTKKSKEKKITQTEFEKKIIELAEKNLTAEKIGEELKRQEIHSKDFSKKISQILKEKNLYKSPDLKNVEDKLEKIRKHYDKNKQDKRAMRERERVFSMLRKLKKYFAKRKN